jgi:hypothetical protein
MTINEITEQSIEQTCDFCGHVRSSNMDDLTVGIATNSHINADVVPLPPCESCGAAEYLIPSAEDAPDHPAPGSFGHRHAILVDILHERLVERGRVASGIETAKLKKRKRTKEEIDHWFEDGLDLAPLSDAPRRG